MKVLSKPLYMIFLAQDILNIKFSDENIQENFQNEVKHEDLIIFRYNYKVKTNKCGKLQDVVEFQIADIFLFKSVQPDVYNAFLKL